MAHSLDARLAFPTDTHAAFALLSDPAYIEEVATRTGGTDTDVSVTPQDGGVVIVSTRTLPAHLPSYAKALVGDHVVLTETRTFGPAAEDGSRDGTVTVWFHGAPITVDGTLRISVDGDGADCDITMSVKASVPFVGGKIEKFAAEEIQKALRKEQEVVHDHTS